MHVGRSWLQRLSQQLHPDLLHLLEVQAGPLDGSAVDEREDSERRATSAPVLPVALARAHGAHFKGWDVRGRGQRERRGARRRRGQ